ncbi:MAG TPA: GNAT family N-acetyltransferase [Pseudonocardia sp.]|uniref:GNAT family N-acetyltransferase n=1 Tax=Pseudonocardia sp. TaxID=60912 RepID=UPI002F40E709
MLVISSPRLLLRTLTAAEAERLLAADPGRFAEGYPSAFAAEVLRLVALYPVTDHPVDDSTAELGPWLVLRRTDDALLGVVSCARTTDPSAVTVGYDIAPSCWGRGYATEALASVADHLLGVPGLARVCADAPVEHLASRRVMEKVGMGWQRDDVELVDGREVKLAHYALERAEPAR